jgi:hypothetical protein
LGDDLLIMHRTARRDDRLGARVVGRRALVYTKGADASIDQPAHVRAASSLVHFRGKLAVAQDDASFLALVTPDEVHALALPSPTGVRQFDDGRGNKKDKLDLEALAVVRSSGRDVLLAFGSGSAAKREVIVTLDDALVVHDASRFYAALPTAFRGSELNLEGAVALGSNLMLVQRGNGAPRGDLKPVDATALVSISALMDWLAGRGEVPAVHSIATWDLGAIDGCRLTFTDATAIDDTVLFSAAAEDSPDALSDGVVTGVAIGVLDEHPRWAPVIDESGAPLRDKIEGIAPNGTNRLWAVVDVDDHAKPSELLEIELTGPWIG